ncbi:MAG: small, acid-soluble spore protein, alpha/beta type [Desulfitobacteriaceae bacterium]|nr:small, acid-soluble spore protein, alpha/beta type [Desulfitobacteriaceae bacterium]MDD4752448.1 small, acid-soluble spore protein, alpha/beta type [Desulfitobacteriaceae bacterium]
MKKTSDDMEKLKLEIAEEIGLLDKVKSQGWAGLSAAESGRIGGLLIQRKKRQGN